MYESFYGLRQSAFSLLPDPAFLFPSRQHVMALTLLKYGLMSKHAFTVITGEVGSGKTTLLNRLLQEVHGRYTLGTINFTDSRVTQLWPWILQAFGMPYAGKSTVRMYDEFLQFLQREHRAGRTVALVVDESQNLAQQALENLRMLSNVNARETLLQIILVGQPEFRATLKRPDFRQLNQRVSLFYRLEPFDATETRDYIEHRVRAAGGARRLFSDAALALIWRESAGIPRRINTLCDLSLVYGFSANKELVDEHVVAEMLRDRRDLGVQTEAAPAPARKPPGDSGRPLRVVV